MKNRLFMLLSLFILIFSGCSGSSSSSDGDGSATVRFSLKDAPSITYKAVYVSVDKVQVQKGSSEGNGEGGWITVSEPGKTYNLMELVNGAKAVLGDYELEDGTYGQIRLILSDQPDSETNLLGVKHQYPNYVIDSQNEIHKLKVPSGYQSGIKIVGGFSVQGNDFEILLDFDAERSVVKAGNSGQWLLKPVIKSVIVSESGKITGFVKDAEGRPIEDALVSLQKPGSLYPEIMASTKTDESGKYLIEAESGSYIIVASDEDYDPSCEAVTIITGVTATKDFNLEKALNGKVSWTLNVSGLSSDASVSIHILSASPCSGSSYIEVKTFNIINGGDGETELPVGSYIINYTNSETGTTGSLGVLDVTAGADFTFDINL